VYLWQSVIWCWTRLSTIKPMPSAIYIARYKKKLSCCLLRKKIDFVEQLCISSICHQTTQQRTKFPVGILVKRPTLNKHTILNSSYFLILNEKYSHTCVKVHLWTTTTSLQRPAWAPIFQNWTYRNKLSITTT